jgi:RNA polymerase sigma-70 factor, ECF subfamily
VSTADLPRRPALWSDSDDAVKSDVESQPQAAGAAACGLDLRALFDQNYASVWRLLRRFGVLHSHLDDAAQEVFWVAARRMDTIRAGSERAFLYGVALRVASDHLRRRLAVPALADSEALLHLADPSPSPEQQLEAQRARELLDVVLDRLPLELRTVFVFAELEGLEVRQIAELEAIPLGTASSRLRRAREEFAAIAKRLRAMLATRGVER